MPKSHVVIEKPGGDRITRRADGTSILETVEGERIERKPKPPRRERPLLTELRDELLATRQAGKTSAK